MHSDIYSVGSRGRGKHIPPLLANYSLEGLRYLLEDFSSDGMAVATDAKVNNPTMLFI